MEGNFAMWVPDVAFLSPPKPKEYIAYQCNNSIELFEPSVLTAVSFSTWKLGRFGAPNISTSFTHNDVIAKWIIKPKGGIPKLDTPILSDEDVKDLND